MKAQIVDQQALRAITPAALAAYARGEGWAHIEAYGRHSDVYAHPKRPELVIPRTESLADYPRVVAELIGILAETSGRDELALYRDLIGADRDVVRVRARASADDGSVSLAAGVGLVENAREMLLAAACAATNPQPLYRAGANKEANEYLQQVRLGQTEHGSFVVRLLAPVPPLLQPVLDASWTTPFDQEPYERKVTRRLIEALEACCGATEQTMTGTGMAAFERAVKVGVSANLCEAVARLVACADGLEIGVTWARTRPGTEAYRRVRFSSSDAAILSEAARTFRARHSRPDMELFGTVFQLKRDQDEAEGLVTLKALVDGKIQSVKATLDQANYRQAVQAHDQQLPVLVRGDLERIGQRWRLNGAELLNVGMAEDEDNPTD
ncbi:hypothetical protein [uncultured Thiocystis sp.]|jgi:hypothetical protein|uniref:hypothetical protein n=1 Tax=uncultured Thiocystis sp. TaxID=1202134 RepID=UPI0025DA7DA0|nr:hypothetical protein [uncultured Thiocystis sp.]